MYSSVIIVAAGKGRRMGADINKQYLKLDGKEILAHTIEKFERSNSINEIIVVTSKDELGFCWESICKKYGFTKVKKIVAGGKERQDSVYNGLIELDEKAEIVLIHDGARPLIRHEQIEESIKVASQVGGCVVGVPVKDTIKICDNNQKVLETPSRDTLWSVQTPQVFQYDIIMEAYEEGFKKKLSATDDSMMVEALGYPVEVISGRYDNIKITTPEDLVIAENMVGNSGFED